MKLSGVTLAVLAVFILAGGALAPQAQAETLIDFTDSNPNAYLYAGLYGDTGARYSSWTQTVSTTNTAIGAIVTKIATETGTPHAWLMNQVGPGTTAANEIASADFSAPTIPNYSDLTTAPYTTLFTGLSLAQGTYYLVLQGPAAWLGNEPGDTVVNAAAGFTVGPYGAILKNLTMAPYIPASEFHENAFFNDLSYRVETNPVPLPPTVFLLGSGLLGLAGWRRLKKG
jgi:hypothetical protein